MSGEIRELGRSIAFDGRSNARRIGLEGLAEAEPDKIGLARRRPTDYAVREQDRGADRFLAGYRQKEQVMMFSFWAPPAGREASLPNEGVKEWQAIFPDFCILDDSDVTSILEVISKKYVEMYKIISLPACRSDVARLVLIRHCGGMYVDIHNQPGNIATLACIFSLLAEYELILCDRVAERQDKDDMSIANGAIWSRKDAGVSANIMHCVLGNLLDHMKKEDETGGYVPYNIAVLSGSWAILESVYDLSCARPLPLREEAKGKVYRYPHMMNKKMTPFHFYRHYGYREAGQHWSEQQKTQRLFSE